MNVIKNRGGGRERVAEKRAGNGSCPTPTLYGAAPVGIGSRRSCGAMLDISSAAIWVPQTLMIVGC